MAAAPEQLDLDAARSQTEALYRQHGAAVFRICRAVLRDRGEAEDATQQVFLSAHRALLGGAVPREPLAWLATIARRECWTRSSAPAPAVERDEPTARDAAADAIRNAELGKLWTAIAELPQPQREALLLREIRGLSYVQLAEELSLSAPATRSLLARARQRLRVRLRDLQAALGGASWIETLARLFAGGGSPVAPVTRAAALGLGAAAIAGGAIVTPSPLEHHVRRPVAVATVAPPVHDKARVEHPVVRVHPVVRPRAVEVVRTPARHASSSRRSRHEGRGRSATPMTTSNDSRNGGDSHGSGSGRDGTQTTLSTSGHDGEDNGGDTSGTSEAQPTTQTTVSFQTSGNGGRGDGSDGDHGGDSSGSGDSGHGGGSDGSGGSDGGN